MDDYWDRIRDSNRYLDRLYDQSWDDRLAAELTTEVYAGLVDGDHGRVRDALDLPPEDAYDDPPVQPPPWSPLAGWSAAGGAWSTAPARSGSWADAYAESLERLRGDLAGMEGLPAELAERWCRALSFPCPLPSRLPAPEGTLERIQAAIDAVSGVRDEVERAEIAHRPDPFSVNAGMAFFQDLRAAKSELGFLEDLLEGAWRAVLSAR